MKVKRVGLEGFGKYRRLREWKPEVGLYIVSGRNGSGKSTLYVESLGWCLFGDTYKGVRADDVINDKSEKCYVEIESDLGLIRREKIKGSGSKLYINGSVCDDGKIEALIGFGKRVFFNSVVFGSGLSGFLHLNAVERKQALTFSFDYIDKIVQGLKDGKSGVSKEYQELYDRIGDLEQERSDTEKSILDLEKFIGVDIDKVKQELEKYKNLYNELNRELNALFKENDNESEKTRVRDELNKSIKELDSCKSGVREIEYRIDEIERRYKKLEKYDECPQCGQIVSQKYKEGVKEKAVAEIERLQGEKASLQKNVSEVQKQCNVYKDKMDKLEKEEEENKRKMRELKGKMDEYSEKIAEYNFLLRKYEKYSLLIDEKKKRLRAIDGAVKELRKELEGRALKVEAHEFWIERCTRYKMEAFRGIIDNFVPVMNKFLLNLSAGRFSADFVTGTKGRKRVSEVYDIEIRDGSESVDYNRLSNGEKRMVTLGVNMCFQYMMSKYFASDWNLLVFDEVFDGLDSGVRERVVDLLLELVEETKKCVVVVTHDEFGYRSGEWELVKF